MNNNLNFLDLITILSFCVGVYALKIALENLEENRWQNNELKDILHYLEFHLQSQDLHLENQDKLIANLTKGE